MTISSSLAAGVSGLNANAQKLASISDNIANSSTFGYKRTMTDFHSMVLGSGNDATYTAGGVRTSNQRLVDERGQIQGSTNSTDIAVGGRGFIPTARATSLGDAGGAVQLELMTTGSFRPDDEGTLLDPTGMALLGWPANGEDEFAAFPRDSAAGLEAINIYHNQYSANPTTEMTMNANLPASETKDGAPAIPQELSMEYFGNLGQTETLKFDFTPIAPANDGDPPTHTWDLSITDSATVPAVPMVYRLEFNDGALDGGTLKEVTRQSGPGGDYVDEDGTITLAVGGGTIELELGKKNDPGGMTQLDSSFAPTNLIKNGSAVGNLLGVEIDEGGIVHAVYDSGFTRPIYQVPVVDVPNVNGLKAGDNQTYTVSLDSGPMFLWDAGQGPVGETVGFAREASTVDVAHELTQLIQTQRAYSSNAKIVQTVDEMLQETTNLKR